MPSKPPRRQKPDSLKSRKPPMTLKQYEKTAEDERADKAAVDRINKQRRNAR